MVSGEAHYKAILEAARVRKRAVDRGYRLADTVKSFKGDFVGDDRGFCDHDTPCGCYAEGYAAGRMERHEKTPVDVSSLRRFIDHVYRAAEEAGGIMLPEP